MASPNNAGRRYIVIGLVWLLVAIGLGATGRMASWRPPVPQIVLGGLTVLLLVAFGAIPRFRQWLQALDLRWLVALHLTRFVGIYFFYIYYRYGARSPFPADGATSSLRPWLSGCSGWPGGSSPDAGWSACGTCWA
jgi:hypothetical protein